jgi:hypothetical protein
VCYTVAILLESFVKVLDFSIETFWVTCGLSMSDKCGENSVFLR